MLYDEAAYKLKNVLSDVYKTNYYRGQFNLQKGFGVAFM